MPNADSDFIARRLADETGITYAQAKELVDLLGLNWPSLLREARMLNPKR